MEDKSQHCQHIFLMSHMRANTSLISHILGSHPQINGYYEKHISYLSQASLREQEQQLPANKGAKNDNTRYLFDKILHNAYKLRLDNLDSQSIKVLLSIRAPEQTLKSIISLFRNKKTQHAYADPEKAVSYYIQRIKILTQFCEQYKKQYYYYDADLIRSDSKKSLSRIQKWLSLSTPLAEEYQIFSLTGKPRVGDSSENMQAGHIVKQQSNYEEIIIEPKLLQKAVTETYKNRQIIIEHAIDSMISR